MRVTDVRLRRLQPEGRMRAYASVTLDDEFVVHELRVIDGPNGLFVAMPSRRASTGEYRDIAHPITAEARQMLQGAVLQAFAQASTEMANQATAARRQQVAYSPAASNQVAVIGQVAPAVVSEATSVSVPGAQMAAHGLGAPEVAVAVAAGQDAAAAAAGCPAAAEDGKAAAIGGNTT